MNDAAGRFLSLAKTQRVLAAEYRRWAREAATTGDCERHHKYAAEARRLFREAMWHLRLIRRLQQ